MPGLLALLALVLGVSFASDAVAAAPAAAPEHAARIEARFDADAFVIGASGINTWIARSAAIVSAYYGRFPTPVLRLKIVAAPGAGVRTGHAYPGSGPGIEIAVGKDTSAAALEHDWVLVHEFIHLALPELAERHNWLAEGLATYVEGMARVGAGNMTAEELWQEYVDSMPKGEPKLGDAGLDRTPSWARTYWGGALFSLNADVEIRAATAYRKGLRDALRAILAASGGMRVEWPIERVLAVGDAATGTTVLAARYALERDRAVTTDLAALWSRLGIEVVAGELRLDSATPAAALRLSLTAAEVAPAPPPVELIEARAP